MKAVPQGIFRPIGCMLMEGWILRYQGKATASDSANREKSRHSQVYMWAGLEWNE